MRKILLACAVFVACALVIAPALAAPKPAPNAASATWSGSGVTSEQPGSGWINEIVGAKVSFKGWASSDALDQLGTWGGGFTFVDNRRLGDYYIVELSSFEDDGGHVNDLRTSAYFFGQAKVTTPAGTQYRDFWLAIDESVPSYSLEISEVMSGTTLHRWYVSGKDLKGKIRIS